MGLTKHSVGQHVSNDNLSIQKHLHSDKIIALAGNPNVGKSTVFNALTGMHQHTGNWSGKTVGNAQGLVKTDKNQYILVDIPGTYSLIAHSAEEAIARNFICFGESDAVLVVCDATCLERNLNLVLQILEISERVLVCINLMDEAKRRHIHIDIPRLSDSLRVPIIGITARSKKDLAALTGVLDDSFNQVYTPFEIRYSKSIEEALGVLAPNLQVQYGYKRGRWLARALLEEDAELNKEIAMRYGEELLSLPELEEAKSILRSYDINSAEYRRQLVFTLVKQAESFAKQTVTHQKNDSKVSKADRVLTGRFTAYPIMLVLLAFVFWLTITGANYPSQYLADGLFWVQDQLTALFTALHAPDWLHGALVLGIYRVLAWVVSVMLPPMAIFFPLFTLLEDIGYLPRIAYNLDKPFHRCHACGKQALTMCMGLGCNAVGVVGCRIIDSPRERLLAILTNSFVPCNGRFPTILALLTMFFVSSTGLLFSSLKTACLLSFVIVLGVIATFLVTALLSKTILKGVPSSFTLELPPFRRPQIGKIIWRSLWERTIFVLGRAAAVAAPAGLLIWIMANVFVYDSSLLQHCADFLDPFARLLGLDGVILIAFILGFPANEIVIPIIIMAYTASGTLFDISDLTSLKELFINNGWSIVTAINTALFSLFHWPCSTTIITIHKETGSIKWTVLAVVLPTIIGMSVCILSNLLFS